MTEHGARAVRRYVRVCLRQGHAVRGPVVAGVIDAVGERPAVGVRAGQNVVLVTGNLIAPCIQCGRALNVVAVALLVAMEIGDTAGDQLTLGIVPGPVADAIARVQTRHGAPLFLAKVSVPRMIEVQPAGGLGGVLTNLVGTSDPAKIASAGRVGGNE